MERTYRVGTRTSPLALKQVEEILEDLRVYYPLFKAEVIKIDTIGDRDKQTPISNMEGSDFFTRDIDLALLLGKIDFAVHSAKDLPNTLAQGLSTAAITASIDLYDVLVSKNGLKLDELPKHAKIGTSSKRRKKQFMVYRPDFKISDIRGNIEQRLKLLDESDLDAILIAAAGLVRLGLEHRITQRLPINIMQPHPLQGALAVVVRSSDLKLLELFKLLDVQSYKLQAITQEVEKQ